MRWLVATVVIGWSVAAAGQLSGQFYLEKSTFAKGEPVFLYIGRKITLPEPRFVRLSRHLREAIMTSRARSSTLSLSATLWRLTLAVIAAFVVLAVGTPAAQAQTFTVLHDFTGEQDGGNPSSGVTRDAAGNLYGTASVGGNGHGTSGHGVVYKLTHRDSGWVLTTLYEFQGGNDGSAPAGGVVFGPDGALYGTTEFGGSRGCQEIGCGTVFRLSPPGTICHTITCPWTETTLYRFQGQPDASWPLARLTFDSSGNLYGTTFQGGSGGYGAVFELAHSDGGWSESVVHSFDGTDGTAPGSEIIFDPTGNLYGTAPRGGNANQGVAYELSPSESGWQETTLFNFPGWPNPGFPSGGVIFGPTGVLYGTTSIGGESNIGSVYQLTLSRGGWNATTLYSLQGGQGDEGPNASPTMDSAGNLYSTTVTDGNGCGTVFKLTRSGSDWVFTNLHTLQNQEGCWTYAGVVLDGDGNVYGTSYLGGTYFCQAGDGGCGTIWEVTP